MFQMAVATLHAIAEWVNVQYMKHENIMRIAVRV